MIESKIEIDLWQYQHHNVVRQVIVTNMLSIIFLHLDQNF